MGESENNEDPLWYKASIITLARRQLCTTRNSCAEQTQGSSKLPCAAAQGHCTFCRQLGAVLGFPGFFPSGRTHLKEELLCSAASTAHWRCWSTSSPGRPCTSLLEDSSVPCHQPAWWCSHTLCLSQSIYLSYFYPTTFRQNLPLSRFIGGKWQFWQFFMASHPGITPGTGGQRRWHHKTAPFTAAWDTNHFLLPLSFSKLHSPTSCAVLWNRIWINVP